MTVQPPKRSGLRLFTRLLLKGQRVDWKHSLVVVLVITGMFSTPLVLGSIRNRVYVAVKDQIEKENNVREIVLQVVDEKAPAADDKLIAELENRFPGLQAVGNHKLIVTLEGPAGSDMLTLETLAPNDPRQAPLRLTPKLPRDFGSLDLVVSEATGKLLFGESWEDSWTGSEFLGDPVSLVINERPISSKLFVVTKRQLPGRGAYVGSTVGAELRRYTEGLGSPALGLPADPGLLEHALPPLTTVSCLVVFDDADPSCSPESRDVLSRRLVARQRSVESDPVSSFPPLSDHEVLRVRLTEWTDAAERLKESRGNCREALAPHLVDHCNAAFVIPEVALEVGLERPERPEESGTEITLAAAGNDVRRRLPGAEALEDQYGIAPDASQSEVDMAVPDIWDLHVGESLRLTVADEWIPARVQRLYSCPDAAICNAFADPMAVFRLQNLFDGAVEISTREPLVYVPVQADVEYDEILAYAPRVEDVERISEELRGLYPGFNVQYKVAALDKLRRQDSRLSTLFTLTISLSALFIVLALGALARINVERRRRQIAQMLLLGFRRGFVRRLIVGEYLLMTAAAAGTAVGLTALVCSVARRLLTSDRPEQGFEVIVQSMGVDVVAFFQVFAVVAFCTWSIALVSARKAARTDPINLLD